MTATATRIRKITKTETCNRHAAWFDNCGDRSRRIECFAEGGPGSMTPGCSGGRCRLWPGTDFFVPEVCSGEYTLEWTYPDTPKGRLEYLRGELRTERISYGELAELQNLAEHIDPSDVELLEAAGVPEH